MLLYSIEYSGYKRICYYIRSDIADIADMPVSSRGYNRMVWYGMVCISSHLLFKKPPKGHKAPGEKGTPKGSWVGMAWPS